MIQKSRVTSANTFFSTCLLLLITNSFSLVFSADFRTYRDGSYIPTTTSSSSTTYTGSGGGTSTTTIITTADTGITKILYQTDFTPSYTITTPGTFLFGEPIKFQGTDANTSALTIAASDVTVDLNGYSLTYAIDDETITDVDYGTITFGRNTGVNGIMIDPYPQRSNISIANGAVRMFTGCGIKANGRREYNTDGTAATTLNTGSLSNITVNRVKANNNKIGMCFVAGTTTTTIKSATPASQFIVSNARVIHCTADFNDDTGIIFNTVTNSSIIGSTANSNGTDKNSSGNLVNGGSGASVTGFDIQNSRNLMLKDNTAILNTATSGHSYGIYLHRNGLGSTNLAAGTYSTGTSALALRSESYYSVDCFIENNQTQLNDWGFRDELSPSSTVYTKNISVNNGTTKDGRGNYFIFFASGSSGSAILPGHGRLIDFTKVASLSALNALNTSGSGIFDNISIGAAGVAAPGSAGSTGLLTPSATV